MIESGGTLQARLVDPARARPASDAASVGAGEGFNLHAGVALGAFDRDGRERLCRYLMRPQSWTTA